MTAQEFTQYMPADALAATIAHVVESIDPDKGNMIVNVCWRQLIALVGEYRATYMVFGNNDGVDQDIAQLLDGVQS